MDDSCLAPLGMTVVVRQGDGFAYLEAVKQWLHMGSPKPHPLAKDFGILLCEWTKDICEIEQEFRLKHGELSSWAFYNPDYCDEMLRLRRDAVTKGEDPDAAAINFTKTFYPEAWSN